MIPKEKVASMDVRLDALHVELEKLHTLYEQHFAGVLKREPQKEHQSFKSKFMAMGSGDLKTTAAKFRHQGLQQKYIQYNTMWGKILKQIEEGTHHRDLFLLAKKAAAESKAPAPKATPAPPPQYASGSKMLDALYEKMREMVSDANNLPPKEKFVATIQRQIDDQKIKNPDRKVEVKLQRDASGKVQVKLGLKAKEPK